MGIQGLLKNLHPLLVPPPNHHPSRRIDEDGGVVDPRRNRGSKSTTTTKGGNKGSAGMVRHNVRQFAGKSLAIDASSWLHRAAYGCAERLVESIENDTRDAIAERCYTNYMLERCSELLTHANIVTIYLVFDGTRVPLKSGTNADREGRRRANIEEARSLKRRGMHREAGEKYLQCVRGTELMARVVCDAVERRWGRALVRRRRRDDDGDVDGADASARVRCVWSPYEADAQLVKLCVDGHVHGIITEDSDVLVYSAIVRMPIPIIYKLDRKDGSCDVLTMDWLLNPKFDPYRTSGGYDDDDDDVVVGGYCDDEYVDDMGFAPVRRMLPPPPVASSIGRGGAIGSDRGGNRGIGRGRGGKKLGNGDAPASDSALLTVLRSFANRERSEPGAGVRLFVQACVLSGCDYVPNRLSKVGPITAFRLTRESSHREPGDRFGRVLRGLPPGSGIIAEMTSSSSSGDGEEDGGPGNGGNGNDDDDDDDDDVPLAPDADRDARGRYEELLSKSEAVFYYHLVREMSTGNVVPLVSHYRSSGDDGSSPCPPDPDVKYRPCVEGFDVGLTFIGSAAEASTNKSESLPAPPAGGDGRGDHQHRNGGWMFTKKHNGGVGPGRVHSQPVRSSITAPTLSKERPKETPMQKYLRGRMTKVSTGATALSSGNNTANTRDTVKSVGFVGGKNNAAKGCSPPPIPIAQVVAAPVPGRNPFSSYTYGCATTETIEVREKSPIAPSSARATRSTTAMKSPFFPSPVKFDYECGGSTPLVERVFEPKSRVDADATDIAVAMSEATAPVEDVPPSSLDDDDNDKSGKQERQSAAANFVNDGDVGNGASFDYGIVLESPPRRASPLRAGRLREFIDRTLSSDNDQLGPRRVSTSPPEGFRNDLFHNGNSPEDVIDLVDDDDDDNDEAENLPAASSTVKENISNCSRSNVRNAKTSSVIGRKFKSPYPVTIQNRTTASSSYGKRRPASASSALLAGFARQERMGTASSSSRMSGTKRKSKLNFFPTNAADGNSHSMKKSIWSERWGFGAQL